MGIFDEYINSLEGKEEIDPLEIVNDLHNLHKQEIDTREAKIGQMNSAIQAAEAEKARLAQELDRQKAKNYDLAQELPGAIPGTRQDNLPDPGRTTIDDLFKKGN